MASSEGTRDFVRIVVAWFLPPVGVFLQVGPKKEFWINLVLTILFYFPGLLHAVWVIAKVGSDGRPVADPSKDFVRLVVSAFAPPVAVFMQSGLGLQFWINLVLTLCFWVPGMLHAAWVITHTEG
jgi:uncharacterized membrane protein YqaE (UPF0057 family)